ncbi:MAG: hypothetical protein NUW01_08955 [Gemmatimonadaceae bacterium]|nr:hypothetical protein [Gemmatimonadaceae bacterium]
METQSQTVLDRRPPDSVRSGGIVVIKFGGTSLETTDRIRTAAQRVAGLRSAGFRPVVVVSARGDTTDKLLRQVHAVTGASADGTSHRELDRALATGEILSAALLASALNARGVPAESVGAAEAVLLAEGPFGGASLRELRPGRVAVLLETDTVPVVTGFQGIREDGELVTLGRGTSDLTAVFLASALRATECHIVTDVDGIYDADPRIAKLALRFDRLSFDDLVTLTSSGAEVVHRDAAEHAAANRVPVRVYRYDASLTVAEGTWVGPEAKR